MKKLTIIGEQEELRCEDNDEDMQEQQLLEVQKEIADLKQVQSPQEDKWKEMKKQKKQKAKQIKKILKERLNIDCLRMLCEDSPDEGDAGQKGLLATSAKGQLSRDNLDTSMHVLMREIGIEQNEGLSQAFLDKNGEAKREQLNSFTEMFSVRDLLGVGAFGVVLLVKNRFTKERSALKIIAKEKLSERAQKILKNESTIMRTMDHPGVVSLKRIFENQKFIILEMELVPGGQLKRLFKLKDKSGTPKPLSDLEASRVMKNLLEGVNYVHARDIIHRDLKPENILLTSLSDTCNDVKIVDFGLSAEQNWRNRQNVRAGTPIYMAPEQVMNGKGYSQKIDLWACGIISYQLLACGQHPCYTPGEINYCKKLQEIETQPIEWNFPDNFSPLARDFFLRLCSYPPSERYDGATALQHPWITRGDSTDIPLNKQQQFAMFEQEVNLRKVMRLIYFSSTVKMAQVQNEEQQLDTCNSESESLPATPTLPKTSNRLSGSPTKPVQKNPQQSERKLSSQEGETVDERKQKYTHNAFLTNSFLEYKLKILAQSDKKQSIDSTSAESNKRTISQENQAVTQPKPQTSLTISKKQSSFNLKSPLKRSPTKSKKHSSKKAGLTANHFGLVTSNNANQDQSVTTTQFPGNFGAKIDAFSVTSSQMMPKNSSSGVGSHGKPRSNTLNQTSQTKKDMYVTHGNYFKGRAGRNALNACSPATTVNNQTGEDLKVYIQAKDQDSFSRRAQFVQLQFQQKVMSQQSNIADSRMLAYQQEDEDDHQFESSLMHTKTLDFVSSSQFTHDLYPQAKAEMSHEDKSSLERDTTPKSSMLISRKTKKAQTQSNRQGRKDVSDTVSLVTNYNAPEQQQPPQTSVSTGVKKSGKKRAVSKKLTTTPLANRLMMGSPQGQLKMKAQQQSILQQQKLGAITGHQVSQVDWMNLDSLIVQPQTSDTKLKGVPQSDNSWQRYMYLDKLIKAEKSSLGAQKMIKIQQALPMFEGRSNVLRTSRPRSILSNDHSEPAKHNKSVIYSSQSAKKSAQQDQSQSLSHEKQFATREHQIVSPLIAPNKKSMLSSAYTNSSVIAGTSLHLQQHHVNANSSPGFPSPYTHKKRPLKQSKTSAKKVDTAQVFKMTDIRSCLSSKSIERLWQQHGERTSNEMPYKQVSIKTRTETNYPFERSNTDAGGGHTVDTRKLSHFREGGSEVKRTSSWMGQGLTSAAAVSNAGSTTQTDFRQNQTNFPDVMLNKVAPFDLNEPLRIYRQRNSCENVKFNNQ